MAGSGQRSRAWPCGVAQAIDGGSIEARSARSGIDWAVGRVKVPVSGTTFCAKGVSETLGGCVGEGGKLLDPTSGKPMYE